MCLRDLLRTADALVGQVLDVPPEIPPVGGDRVAREPALDGQVVEVGLQRGLEGASAQRSTSSSSRTAAPCASATGP